MQSSKTYKLSYNEATKILKKIRKNIVKLKYKSRHHYLNSEIWTEPEEYKIYIEEPQQIDIIDFHDEKKNSRPPRAIAQRKVKKGADLWNKDSFDHIKFYKWFGNNLEDAEKYKINISTEKDVGKYSGKNYRFRDEKGEDIGEE